MDIEISVIGYKISHTTGSNNVLNDRMAGELVSFPKDIDIPYVVEIAISAPKDGNLTIRELCLGSQHFGVEACALGSIVKFKDCRFEAPHTLHASSFEIVAVKSGLDPELFTNPNYLDGMEPGFIRPSTPPKGLADVDLQVEAVLEEYAAATTQPTI
jgi:hypothetical protein